MSSFILKDVRVFTGDEVIESGSVYVNMHGCIERRKSRGSGAIGKVWCDDVMDMANLASSIAKLRQVSRARKDVSHILSACAGAMVEGWWPAPVVMAHGQTEENLTMLKQSLKVTTPEEAEIFVQQNIKDGADYIRILHECGAAMGKSFPSFPKPIQAAIVDASHRHGLLCVAHATCLSDTLELLRAGVDGLMHTFCDQMPTSELIEAYKSKHAFCCPTLGIIGGSDTAGPSTGTCYGLSLHHELYLLVHKAGLTPQEAISSATAVTARRFGIKDRRLIEKGRRADMVLVEGNPLKDISDSLNLGLIWRDGVKISDKQGTNIESSMEQ